MSLNAYETTKIATETSRETELRLFSAVTRALAEARDSGERDQKFFAALDWNRRLWSALSTDCGVEGNLLTDELRAGIISLSIWVSKHTSQVARGYDDDIGALIKVNRTIMEGLAMTPGQAQEGATNADPEAAPEAAPEADEKSTAPDLPEGSVREEV